ncbi:MAG TPA: hypothetical protein VFI54_14170 [Solirubrobacteraceae bacterium]|nr:hypothetical protein [Solirubrobacteraceae bacterium]
MSLDVRSTRPQRLDLLRLGMWIITLSSDGRCRHFEESPFHPGQARTAL